MRTKPRASDPLSTVPAVGSTPVRIGRLATGSTPGALLVDFDGNPAGPLSARSVVALDEAAIQRAIAARQPVVLLFETATLPIVVGLVAPEPGAAMLGALLQQPAEKPIAQESIEARVDGKRVVIEGAQEVMLRCGDASITLRPDGKVILRGAYIETTATGVNRIRGGSVKIN
jgi:hypothetical protein